MTDAERRAIVAREARNLAKMRILFEHQGRKPHIGLDCAGVVYHCARRAGFDLPQVADYRRVPNPRIVEGIVSGCMTNIPSEDREAGDVGLFDLCDYGYPVHMGVLTSRDTVVTIEANAVLSERDLSGGMLDALHSVWRMSSALD